MLPEHEERIKGTVRNIIAVDPLVSIRKVQRIYEEKTGKSISDKYVSKIMHKVRRQAVVESDRKKINERLAEVRETFRVMREDLTRYIYWKHEYQGIYGIQRPSLKDRMAAMKLLGHLELSLLRAERDCGIFEDKRGAVENMLEQGVLPTELREQVVGVFRTWKFSQKENMIVG